MEERISGIYNDCWKAYKQYLTDHDMGKFKWKEYGDKYPLENVPIPTREEINRAKEILGL